MKKIVIVLTVIINFFIVDKIQAEIKISYLNLDKVVSTSLAGKSINDQFITLQKNNQKKFKAIKISFLKKKNLL